MSSLRFFFFLLFRIFNLPLFLLAGLRPSAIMVNGFLMLVCRGQISVGKGGRINSSSVKNMIGGDRRSSIVIKRGARLTIGDNFKMSNSALYCADRITIGDNVMIGGSCKIWDTDFHPLSPDERKENPNEGYQTAPIVIGSHVFIGGCAIILKGVSIGDHSIIGAGSVVSRNIPSGEVWAGNPAKFIKKVNND